MSKTYIGIDPGKSGYIACLNEDSPEIYFYPIPVIGKELDIFELNNIIHHIVMVCDDKGQKLHCVIEDLHAIFGAGAGATFEFGFGCGALEAILVANHVPFTKVTPKKWQKQIWEGVPSQTKPSSTGKTTVTDTKLMSLLAAKRIFPDIDLRATERCKKAHDGKVDALLILEYCRRNF